MQGLLENLSAFFTFIFTQLGNFATFFTTNTLGQVILGIVLFSVVSTILMHIINRLK